MMLKYGKTPKFRDFYSNIKKCMDFQGMDENGYPIIYSPAEYPDVKVIGSPKVHGTNAGISIHPDGVVIGMSKENILVEISPDNDVKIKSGNANFEDYVIANYETFREIRQTFTDLNIVKPKEIFTIYGEWTGKGIQNGVAVNSLDKFLMVFNMKMTTIEDGNTVSRWIDEKMFNTCFQHLDKYNTIRMFNIKQFTNYEFVFNINNVEACQEYMDEKTLEVEENCPVASFVADHDNVELPMTIGEGIVWIAWYKNERFIFKTKGDKHTKTPQKSKKTRVSNIDIEQMKNITEFIETYCTEDRMEQGIQQIFGIGNDIDIKQIGDYIRWVVNDIRIEEADVISESGLEMKHIGKYIQNKAKRYFFDKLKEVG
ncbi:RNA ligase family protein [uncultured Arcobacter sp.]|uniref:RNA ligase family protein n=1 Tax=uncultured Arcobacter sp. TaxID=165434 RepID=UPI00261764BA|nr:RNA ligase family protein [uncultured Arcobacter sp.]